MNVNKLFFYFQQTSFEIYELDYHCSYEVNVNRSWKPKNADSKLVLTVPGCDYFKRKSNGTITNCDT